jgi:hypothetical protein
MEIPTDPVIGSLLVPTVVCVWWHRGPKLAPVFLHTDGATRGGFVKRKRRIRTEERESTLEAFRACFVSPQGEDRVDPDWPYT